MWEALAEVAKHVIDVGGLTGAVFVLLVILLVAILVLWTYDRRSLVGDLKEQNSTMIEAFKDNTAAVSKLSTLIDQLCSRI